MSKKKEKKKQKNKTKSVAVQQERMDDAPVTAADENRQPETASEPDESDKPVADEQTAADAETKRAEESEEKQIARRTRREIAYDLYCAGMSCEKIAEKMGVTVVTAKQYVGAFGYIHNKLDTCQKGQTISFRVTDTEFAVIRKNARLSYMDISEYMIKCALKDAGIF